MKEKLQELLEKENLRPGQLAERLDVNPASISHILKGRNKPGIDLLQKILRAFPNLNPDWLLLDAPQYERSHAHETAAAGSNLQTGTGRTIAASGVPATEAASQRQDAPATGDSSSGALSGSAARYGSVTPTSDSRHAAEARTASGHPDFFAAEKEVKRIIVLYTDNTFESYTPTLL